MYVNTAFLNTPANMKCGNLGELEHPDGAYEPKQSTKPGGKPTFGMISELLIIL